MSEQDKNELLGESIMDEEQAINEKELSGGDQVESQSENIKVAELDEVEATDTNLEENEVATKLPRKKWKIILAAVVAAVLVVTLVVQVLVRINPVFRTYSASLAVSRKNVLNTKTRVQTDFAHIIDNFLENILIESYSHVDKRKSETAHAVRASFDNKTIIDLIMILDQENMFIDIPQVLDEDEYLYVNMEELMENMLGMEDYHSNADIYKYMDLIDYESLDAKRYTEAIYDELKDHIESSFSTVTYEFTIESVINMVETLLDIMEDDEELYEWFVANVTRVLEAMIDDEFLLAQYTLADYERALETIQDDDFEEAYFDFIEESQDGLDTFVRDFDNSDILDMNYGYIVTYHFNILNQLKQIDVKLDLKMFGSMTISTEYGKAYDFEREYDDHDGQDMYTYIEEGDMEAFEELGDDITDYLEDYLDDNEDLDAFLNDEYGFFVTLIQEAIGNMNYLLDAYNTNIYY